MCVMFIIDEVGFFFVVKGIPGYRKSETPRHYYRVIMSNLTDTEAHKKRPTFQDGYQ